MNPKLQAMLARVEAMHADAFNMIDPRSVFSLDRNAFDKAMAQAEQARAEFNRAVREESEREANLP